MDSFEQIKSFLRKSPNVNFRKHFCDRICERPITEELVRTTIKKVDDLLSVEEQDGKYKLWFKMSSRYSLVLIASITKKDLNIITGWKTSKRWQKELRK